MIFAVDATFTVQSIIDAISVGSIIALYAMGVSLIFGIMRLINFAHGELIMVAAFALVFADELPLAAQIGIAVAAAVVFALAVERLAFRPIRGANPATLLATSFAVSFFLQSLAATAFGSLPRTTNIGALTGTFEVGGIPIERLDIITILTAAALLAALAALLRFTMIGISMRAAAEDFTTARLLGVRANAIIATAFAVSGVLAAAAAVLRVAQTGSVTPTVGINPLLFAFIATVLGGLGSLPGSVVGAYILGAGSIALQIWLPLDLRPLRDAFLFGAVFLILLLRPQGLFVPKALQTRV